jgi:hypothetical protein
MGKHAGKRLTVGLGFQWGSLESTPQQLGARRNPMPVYYPINAAWSGYLYSPFLLF